MLRPTGVGFEEAHGGRGFGIRNPEGERMLEFDVANNLACRRQHPLHEETFSTYNLLLQKS